MAYLFDISQAGNTSLQLKPKQPVDVAFQVKNVSGRRIHTRLSMKEATDATRNAWATIKGSKEMLVDIEAGVVQTVTATINVPAGTPAGKSTFFLYAQDTDQPDEGDKSPAISVDVSAAVKPTIPPWVIPVVVAVVLVIAGLGTWLVLRHPSSPNTDDTKKSGAKVATPMVTGMKLGDAQAILGYQKFTNIKLAPDLSGGTSTPGLVYGQDPAANTPVTLETPISLRFVPTSVTVPNELAGKDFGAALAILQTAGLQFGGVCCMSSPASPQTVLSTSPAVGTPARVGQSVVLYNNPLGQVPPATAMTATDKSITAATLQNTASYRMGINRFASIHFPMQTLSHINPPQK